MSIAKSFLFNMKGMFCMTLTDLPGFGVWREGRAGCHAASLANSHVYRKVGYAPVLQSTWTRRPCRNPECFSIWNGNQKIRGFILSLRSKPWRKDIEQILTQSFVATRRIYWPEWQTWTAGVLAFVFTSGVVGRGPGSGVNWQWKEYCHSR